VLECLRLSLACGRAGDDGDVMAAWLVRPTLSPLPGQVAYMAASCCFRVTWRFSPLCASVVAPQLCVWAPHTRRSRTCRARRGLVVAETEAGSSSGKLVGDAAVRPRTRRLASKGLDEDLQAFPEMLSFWMLQSVRVRPSSSCLPADRNLQLEGNGFVILERDNLVVEGGPNPGPRQQLCIHR
jgi:hypothetical protein